MSDNPERCTIDDILEDDPLLTDRPTKSELDELLHTLVDWQKFATHLPRVSEPMIKAIERDKSSVSLQKLAMFAEWLKADPFASWKAVIKALIKADEHDLAVSVYLSIAKTQSYKASHGKLLYNHIVDTYCFVEKSSEENVTESVNVKPQQSSELDHQQMFSDQHGLHIESNDIQQQMISEAQVKEDFKKLSENFASVVMNVKVKLAVLVENEPSKLTQITQYIEEHYQLSHLAEVKDVNELFDSISFRYCFLSCDLVKGVVEEFLSGDEVHSEITQYLKDLDTFKMSTQLHYIKTAIKEVLLQNQEVTETCTVSIKLNEIWGCTTLKKFENFFCLTFGKNLNCLNQLCTELGKECVCVSFVIPLSKLEFLIDKVLPQKEFIQRVGIIEMSVNNDIIISPDETTITNLEQCFLEFAVNGNQFGISTLLELGVDVDHKSSEGRTALMIASYAGYQQCVQMLTSANANVDIQDNKGYTALMLATKCNSIDIVCHLLSVNASVNLQTHEDDTALIIACRNCLFDIVNLLSDYKADPLVANYKALLVSTATEQHNDILVQLLKCLPPSESDLSEVLSVACLNGQPQIIATLLQHIDTSITSEQIQITIACAKGDHSTVEKYINHSNVDVNYPFLPPLIIASSCGHISIVNMLLKQQVNVTIETQSGLTSLMAASKNGHYHIAELLQKYSSVDDINKLCLSAFNSAHYSEAIRLLPLVSEPKSIHTNVCDTNIPSTKGNRKYFDPKASIGLLHIAAWNRWLDIMKTLIDKYKFEPQKGNYNIYILHIAVLNKHIDVMKYLISECGCDPMCKDIDEWTCLHFAGQCGSLNIMEYLITECQCDPMVINKYGSTCLHIAVLNKHIDVVKYLISECGCDPMCKIDDGWTCLHCAGQCGSLDIMKYLITECQCDPMVSNKYGSTCLHIAVLNKHIDVVKYLISECGCDPMCKDNDGNTCLHFATKSYANMRLLTRLIDSLELKELIDKLVESFVPNRGLDFLITEQCASLDIMKYLITECQCDPMVADKFGETCLHIAVLNRHIDVVKYLISECGCDPMCKNNDEWTCLHYAGQCGSLDIMKYLITECQCDPMVTNKYGSICLHIAVLNKHIDVVKYLISECGCDPMCKNNDEWTCLHCAGQCGSLDIMKYLITECQCDPMVINKYGSTCLHIAVLNKHIDVVKYLISECGCDPMCKNDDGWTCLHCAGQCGSLDIMKYVITKCQCDPMVADKYEETCLHIAVLNKHIDVVKYLISECGCDPMCKNDDGNTCLHFAGQCGSLNIMEYLITECQCDPMVINKYGSTCLHIAVLNKHIDVVKYLISECGCDPMCKIDDGWTCLHCAGQCGSLDIMKYLITECQCDPMVSNKYGSTCLHIAVLNKHIDVVKYLISECGCDPMCKDNDGNTCLHFATNSYANMSLLTRLIDSLEFKELIDKLAESFVPNCGLDLIKYLITECQCDPMVTNKYGSTCLHIAVLNKHIDVVKYLISECGCDPMCKTNNGWTCLHYAGQCGSLDIMKYLITECQCDPMVTNKYGSTCLHIAVLNKHIDVVKYLISECGCDPMCKTNNGWTCLHYAGQCGSLDIMKYLITECQCDPMVADKFGETCLHIAVLNKHIDVVKYLISECGCDPMCKENNGFTCLHCAGQCGSLDIMKYLITECQCNPMVTNKYGSTCLHIAVLNKHIDVVKYLISECGCDPIYKNYNGQTCLHCAGQCGSLDIMKYLITECQCNPMVTNKYGSTCLHIAVANRHISLTEYLLSTNRINPFARNNYYATAIGQRPFDKALKNVFTKFIEVKRSHPVDSFVNVLLLGNSGAGKSTLAKVITERAVTTAWFGLFRYVQGVEPYTAGIIPTKLRHKELGNIILHDFAGHPEYYTSHIAVIKNLLQGSAAVFVIVVNIMEEEATKHLQQWLTIVTNEVSKALNQCHHIIVVVSHVDEMIDTVTRERKESELQQIIKERCDTSVSIEYLDCRKLGGGSVSSLFSKVSSACQFIRNTSGRNLNLYCHMMYGLLEESEQNILSLSDIAYYIAEANDEYFLSKSQEEILEILLLLELTGLINVLQSPNNPNKVWVVFNKQILLADVNGILFAPNFLEKHSDAVSNTGIIFVSKLTQIFPDCDPDMLICFFKNMALCREVNPQLFEMTNLVTKSSPVYDDKERFLFFPTLLKVNRPDNIDQEVFQFGWCLQCTEHYHFFSSHFLHSLLLNLSYKYALPSAKNTDDNKLSRKYKFWKNGFYWFNGKGVGTLVELVDESQCVLVLMSCEVGIEKKMISLQRDVITEIMKEQKESCPSLKFSDFIIDPQDLTYPIDKPTQRRRYYIQDIIYCITHKDDFVISSDNCEAKIKLNELLQLINVSHLAILGGHELDKV